MDPKKGNSPPWNLECNASLTISAREHYPEGIKSNWVRRRESLFVSNGRCLLTVDLTLSRAGWAVGMSLELPKRIMIALFYYYDQETPRQRIRMQQSHASFGRGAFWKRKEINDVAPQSLRIQSLPLYHNPFVNSCSGPRKGASWTYHLRHSLNR